MLFLIFLLLLLIFRAVYSLHVDHPSVLDQISEDLFACPLSLMAYLVTSPHMVGLWSFFFLCLYVCVFKIHIINNPL